MNLTRRFLHFILLFAAGCSGFEPLPPGQKQGGGANLSPEVVAYWAPASGLTGPALKSALHEIIDNHTMIPYGSSGSGVWAALQDLDEDPANPNNVLLIYTRRSEPKANMDAGGSSPGNYWNREHTWAKSQGFGEAGNEIWPPYTDLFHMRAADKTVNSARNEKDFDNGGSQHAEATLCYTDSDSWEPPPEVKGDLARGIFYMAVRYNGVPGNEPDLELVEREGLTEEPLFGWLSALKLWHVQDPVSDAERLRNEKIYTTYQHNRNPFIDHPEWVEEIW